MSCKWPEVKVIDLSADTKNAIAMGPFGSRIKTDNFVEYGIPIIKGANLTSSWLNENKYDFLTEEKAEELKSSSVRRGDLVFTHRGTLGQVGYIHSKSEYEEYIVSQSQMKLTVDKAKVLPLFVYYFFKSPLGQHRLLINRSQTGVPAIARPVTSLKNVSVPVPSLPEQSIIVNVLKDIDLKINKNIKTLSNLEELSQTLFKRWFVDFEFPNENGEPYKSNGGKMVESELGMIPEGWEIREFNEIIKIGSGKRPKSRVEDETPLLNIPVLGASKVMGYTDEILFDEPIIVIGRVGTHGVIQRITNPCWPSDNTFVLRSEYMEFMFQFLKTIDYKSLNRGSTQPLLTQRDIKGIKLAVPTEHLFQQFEKQQRKFSALVFQIKDENEYLTELRDTLLPKLLSGEIELPETKEVTDDVPVS